ncbi:MAG: hypothetical protein QOF51_833 [Chloroflexota bacterium]|jgi:hypothetical protein|nr:hypothetical protein [Chloroflexota bacterium]
MIDRSRTLQRGLGLCAAILLACMLAGASSTGRALAAAAEPVQLGLAPVNAPGTYFTLTMGAGESQKLTVAISNHGVGAVQARTFAADAYTIINGGFGARLDGEPTSGTTTWLAYPTQTLELAPGSDRTQDFTVHVPAATTAGQYLTSLVIQNATPLGSGNAPGDGVTFNQTVRQAIAVSITVPGPLVPSLTIGPASHRTVADKSSIAVALQNTGNVQLTPRGQFTLFDHTGQPISSSPITMDSFYAGTATFVEVPLAQRLNPGDYTATLTLAEDGKRLASTSSLGFAVPPAEADVVPQPLGAAAQLTAVHQAPSLPSAPLWPWVLAIVAVLGLLVVLGWSGVWSRRHPAYS